MRHRPVILVTGATGQLGRELVDALAAHGNVVGKARPELDLADADALIRTVRATAPDLVVNAAAYTAVDRAEEEPELAHAVNARAPALLAEEVKRLGAVLVHFSTDYVFDGERRTPYREDAPARPLNVYGESKLAGEQAIAAIGAQALVFRTSWVYGLTGTNFLLTVRRLAAEREELRIVDDQVGVPNWTRTLAASVASVVASGCEAIGERAGLYHLSCRGQASWFEFAQAIVGETAPAGAVARAVPHVVPITTAEFPRPARRPAYGVLGTAKFEDAFGFALPPWRDELRRCCAGLSD